MITDPQGMLLGCLDEHRVIDQDVLAFQVGRAYVNLVVESEDHGPLHGVQHFVSISPHHPALRPASLPLARISTLHAIERRGLVARRDYGTVVTQHVGSSWYPTPREIDLPVLELTDDGRIALGLWRKAKLAAPPAETPLLTGADRELVTLAFACNQHGFAMVPITKTAKLEARRLARGAFAKRGWGGGASTRGLEPSTAGLVEVGTPDAPGDASVWDQLVREAGLRSASEAPDA